MARLTKYIFFLNNKEKDFKKLRHANFSEDIRLIKKKNFSSWISLNVIQKYKFNRIHRWKRNQVKWSYKREIHGNRGRLILEKKVLIYVYLKLKMKLVKLQKYEIEDREKVFTNAGSNINKLYFTVRSKVASKYEDTIACTSSYTKSYKFQMIL